MKTKATKKAVLKDGWTHDPDYRRCYQTEDDVESILGLLILGQGLTLLDIGCGNGAFAIAAAQKNFGCQVWAFDALESAIAQCKVEASALPDFRAEVAWAHAIPLASSSADRVLFRSALHHLAEPQAVYAEISRLLKPGGRLVLQAPCNYWEGSVGAVFSEMMMLRDDSHRRFYYRPAEIVAGLEKAGLSTLPVQKCFIRPSWPSVEIGCTGRPASASQWCSTCRCKERPAVFR